MRIQSLSSQLMTELTMWRNPHGREENWLNSGERIENRISFYGKVAIAELGFVTIATTATIETVVCLAFSTISLIFIPISIRPFMFFAERMDSSGFTILWASSNAICFNLLFINLLTNESMARVWASYILPSRLSPVHIEDRLYVAEWYQRHFPRANRGGLLDPLINDGKEMSEKVTKGAEFIKTQIFSKLSRETLDLCEEMDPSVYLLIITNAVYIYAYGEKSKEEIPSFLKKATRDGIEELRKNPISDEIKKEIESCLLSVPSFTEGPPGEEARVAFIFQLQEIASRELQGSVFLTQCFTKALE